MSDLNRQLPPKWKNCPMIGKVVAQKFLPMKTPLCSKFDEVIEDQLQFHPQYVFQRPLENAVKDARIGMLWDLTSGKLYEKREIVRNGCAYEKLPLQEERFPNVQETSTFIQSSRSFLEENPGDVIAVHCTYGFNLTGFLIVAYLVEACGFSVDTAVQAFTQARPEGIYKQTFLDELCSRYSDDGYGDEDTLMMLMSPGIPSWEGTAIVATEVIEKPVPTECLPIDKELCSNPTSPHSSNGVIQTILSEALDEVSSLPEFLNGAVKDVVYVKDVRCFCGYRGEGFPGTQAVLLRDAPGSSNLSYLTTQTYMVSWKADGVRYLILMDSEQVYAFDRDFNVFKISNLLFPHRVHERQITKTLVDAEMIIEEVQKDSVKKCVPRLLIYDIISFEGKDVSKKNFSKRFDIIKEELIDPRIEAMKRGAIRRDSEPMSIRRKDFYLIGATSKFFEEKFLNSIGHEIDGLIFQPEVLPYMPGPCQQLLKWKPPEKCSIDVKLVIQGEVGNLYILGMNVPLGKITVTDQLKKRDNKIIECIYDVPSKTWKFLRQRNEKTKPNDFEAALTILNAINSPVIFIGCFNQFFSGIKLSLWVSDSCYAYDLLV
uniref:mRNA-capping enzyme n=1 Tax=Ditylenchus dipsaci TaxID=166011 RepID=A0A915DGR4_9BILA